MAVDFNPYASPTTEVRDIGAIPTISSGGRLLLWLAFLPNCLVLLAPVFVLFASRPMAGDAQLAGGMLVLIASISVASLFLRSIPALFWVSTALNSVVALLGLWIVVTTGFTDRASSDPNLVVILFLVLQSLLSLGSLLVNRGKR